MGVLDKTLKTLNALYPMADLATGGLNTTVAAAAAAGATTLTIASGTNSANGDDIRVGSGETCELARILSGGGTTSLTLVKPLKYDHPIGDPVVEQQALNFANPEAEGFTLSVAGETSDVFTATQRLVYAVLNGYVDLGARWSYPVVTADIFALALGIAQSQLIGDGTAAAQSGTVGPRLFTTDGVSIGGVTNMNLVAVGTLQDNTPIRIELYNISFDPSAVNASFSRGQLTKVPVRVLASGGAIDFTNAAWTPSTIQSTYVASKADVFSEITQVSDLQLSGTASTLSSPAAANAYSIVLASASGFAAGDAIQVGTGDAAEVHIVHSVVTNTLNLRTQIFRAFASAQPVTKLNKVAIGGVTGGFTLSASAQTSQFRAETQRVSMGLRIGSVSLGMSMNINSLTPENFQLMFGIPSLAYANNVLPLGARIGTLTAKHLMFEGLTAGGKKLTIIGWNSLVEATGEITFTQAQLASGPISVKPNGLQVIVNNP